MQNTNNKNIPIILFGDKIKFESKTAEKRKEVFEFLSKEKYFEALNLINGIIKENIEYILENTQEIIEEKTNKKKDIEKEKEKDTDKDKDKDKDKDNEK